MNRLFLLVVNPSKAVFLFIGGIPTIKYLRADVRIKTAFCQEKNGL